MSTVKAANLSNLAGTTTSMDNAINGSAKAWVNFNGRDTVAIRAQYNVSSITDNGVGDYTANYTTAFSDANYSFIGSTFDTLGVGSTAIVPLGGSQGSSFSTGTTRFMTRYQTSATDMHTVCVAVFR